MRWVTHFAASTLSSLGELASAAGLIARWVAGRLMRLRPVLPSAEPPASAVAENQPPVFGRSPRARTRRELLTLASVAMGGIAGIIVAIPVVGALLAPLLRPQPPEWRQVGKIADFAIGTTTAVTFEDPSPLSWAGVASQTAAWLRRTSEDQFQAFSVNCTHLGCPVRWLSEAGLFMCPCHGGVFYGDGSPAAGPPQRALFLYPVRVRDGQVEIQSGPVRIV
ncbi:MAG TPA: Rieske (2Fe-2S) protein [Dehalococcoidia bacterium]|nr:Rieske (2Fe-2S) protein [Dehalococcoidia bacterium]